MQCTDIKQCSSQMWRLAEKEDLKKNGINKGKCFAVFYRNNLFQRSLFGTHNSINLLFFLHRSGFLDMFV